MWTHRKWKENWAATQDHSKRRLADCQNEHEGPFKPAGDIARDLKVGSNKTVSRSTVTRRLQRGGLKACVPASKSLISKKKSET